MATVDNGVITAVADGSAQITVITSDGNKTAECTVTVYEPQPGEVLPTGVTLSPASLTLTIGGTATGTLTATVIPDNATNKNVIWSSSDSSVATVSSGGIVTAVGPGTAQITVTIVSGGQTASSDVTVISLVTALDLTSLVTAPAVGASPDTTAINADQYTGTVAWTFGGAAQTGAFWYSRVYKAVVTLTAKSGYTFTGVAANAFSYSGASGVANSANSGTVTITFPATPAAPTVSIETVYIPGGTFQMGSPSSEVFNNAKPQHQVTVSDFRMGKYEVTQEQYQAVMGSNPSQFQGSSYPPASDEVQGKRPVERVSWYNALVFCNWLSIQEGRTPAYTINGSTDPGVWGTVPSGSNNSTWDAVTCNWNANGYRLPTEAEWEYACRAGTTTAYHTGEDTITDSTGWYSGNSEYTHEVGKKPANGWGLYDMAGNVFEWCWDWYGDYEANPLPDPKGAVTGDLRVKRGGSSGTPDMFLRSAYRMGNPPWSPMSYVGFRLVYRPY